MFAMGIEKISVGNGEINKKRRCNLFWMDIEFSFLYVQDAINFS